MSLDRLRDSAQPDFGINSGPTSDLNVVARCDSASGFILYEKMLSTAHDEQQPITTDILVPVTIDGTPLKYDDNPAHAAGMAHAISEHWERVGLFEQLTKYGTVSMTNGRIACTDKDVIPFILGRYIEPVYTFASPCPPSSERISNLSAAHALDNSVLDWNPTANATITSAEQTNIVINHMVVRQEDQKMHRSLMYALSDVPDTAAALQASSGGSGQKLLASFIALKTEATQQDLTLVTNQLNQFIVNGFSGDLKLETFNAHYKAFGEVLRNVPPDKRSADVSYIVMMINSIMYKDPSIRDLWEIKSTVTANMDQLATVLKLARSILRSRKVAKEIDEISTPTSHPSLSADNRIVSATKAEKAALATLKSVKSLVSQGAENSKVAALLAKVDPEKDKKEKKKPRESKPLTANGALVPRDSEGRVTHWIEGMEACKCGKNHLFRDCPDDPGNKSKSGDRGPATRQVGAAALHAPGDVGGGVGLGLESGTFALSTVDRSPSEIGAAVRDIVLKMHGALDSPSTLAADLGQISAIAEHATSNDGYVDPYALAPGQAAPSADVIQEVKLAELASTAVPAAAAAAAVITSMSSAAAAAMQQQQQQQQQLQQQQA